MPASITKNDMNLSVYLDKSRIVGRTLGDAVADVATSALDIQEQLVREVSPQPLQAYAVVPVSVGRRVVKDVKSAQVRLLG